MVWTEIRGDPEVNVFGRRISAAAQRQALAMALIALVGGRRRARSSSSRSATFDVSQSIFESASAFGTVGLSTGITAGLPSAGKIALIVLMYLGRVGPHALGVGARAARAARAATATRKGGRSLARQEEAQFLVIGLGRFGGALAAELIELGHEVLGVDADPRSGAGATRTS